MPGSLRSCSSHSHNPGVFRRLGLIYPARTLDLAGSPPSGAMLHRKLRHSVPYYPRSDFISGRQGGKEFHSDGEDTHATVPLGEVLMPSKHGLAALC